MTCPPQIATTITQLLREGLLRIRASGWSGDSQRCAVEADHLHNLPGLLADFSFDRLRYYWEVERPAFMARSAAEDLASYQPLWADLAAALSVQQHDGGLPAQVCNHEATAESGTSG
jgi:hypothetical protein